MKRGDYFWNVSVGKSNKRITYFYAKAVDEPFTVGQKIDFFISQPELASPYISKSIPVGGPVLLEVQRSVEALHHNNPIVHIR